MKRWILVRQTLAVSNGYGTQFYPICLTPVFVPWYHLAILGRHDFAYKNLTCYHQLFSGWTPIGPEVSVRLKDISNFKDWRNHYWLAIIGWFSNRTETSVDSTSAVTVRSGISKRCHKKIEGCEQSINWRSLLLLNQPILWCVLFNASPIVCITSSLEIALVHNTRKLSQFLKKFKATNTYKIFRPTEQGFHLERYSR